MGDQSGISVFGSGARQHTGRVALLAGLLVVALAPWSSGQPRQVRAATATGSGTAPLFGCAASYAVGRGASSVAVGDLNGDGKQDLVTANQGSNDVSVLLGQGDGTFQPQQADAVGLAPDSVAVGDVNGDGTQDLVAANYNSSTVSVLLGNGDGTFQPQQTAAVGSTPVSVAMGDVNGDGKLDLVTANYFGNNVSVLLGQGDGTFQPQHSYAVGSLTRSVAVGDFNGDGTQDLAVANSGSNTVSVLLGNGDGTFQPQQTDAVGPVPYSVAVGDINGDGKQDLVTTNVGSNNVSVLLGQGDGTFQPQQTAAVGTGPVSVAVGDVNKDGKLDLVTANAGSTVSVLLNSGPCFTPSPTRGYPSTVFTLSGYNYGPGERVNVYWDSTTTPLTRTTTDASGAFTATARVPLATYGTHLLIAVGQSSGLSATTPFQITPIITLAPTSGPSGTIVTAQGAGFGARETITLHWNPGRSGSVLGMTTTSATGSFGGASAITFTVPATAPGSYTVCGLGGGTLVGCTRFTVTG